MSEAQTTEKSGHVLLSGHVDVPADRWDEVRLALQDHIRLTREEPGCIMFNVLPCREVELRLLVDEIFENQQAFDAHQARTKASPWAEITADLPRDYSVRVIP